MADETNAEMPEEDEGVLVMAAASYFFPEIAYKCCKVQQIFKEECDGTDPCLLWVEIAVRITR